MKTHEQLEEELARYALGETAGEERREIEVHLESCASCRRELQALLSDFSLLALSSSGPQPPVRSKERLMRALAAEPRGVSLPTHPRAPEPRRNPWWAWAPAFAAVALLFVVGSLWRGNGRMRDQIAELGNRNQDQMAQLDRMSQELRLLTSPDAVHVSLNPDKMPKQPSGTAIFSPSQKRMMFMASNLAPVPEGMAYELWIIPMKGAPVAAGVFKPDEHGNAMMMDHKMPEGVEAKAFAITVEKEEGAEHPTSPIVLMGARG